MRALLTSSFVSLHEEEFIIRKLAVQLEGVPIGFSRPGWLIRVVVRVADTGNEIINYFFLLSQDSLGLGFDKESLGDFILIEFVCERNRVQ